MMNRVVLVLSMVGFAGSVFAQNNCLDCHRELEDESLSTPARAMREDVHAQAGVTCDRCHGGDPKVEIVDDDYEPAMDPAKGFRGELEPGEIPGLCGGCHSDATYIKKFDPNLPVDQLEQYRTSVHGRKLEEGAVDVAQCASCHGAHGILPVKDPRGPVYPTRVAETCGSCHADDEHMEPYGIPTDQLDQYRTSVHGRALYEQGDLSAPTCNSCHGNHGAAPPGLSSVSLVCGNCHSVQKELFTASPHLQAFEDIGEPECEACHGNHEVQPASDDRLGVNDDAVCMECHFEGEEAYGVAKDLRDEIERLKHDLSGAREVVERADRAGMEVSDADVVLIDANQALVEARNLIHAISVESLEKKTEEGRGLAAKAREMGIAALRELDFRRRWLGVSVAFILLMVVGLYFKTQQIEKKR